MMKIYIFALLFSFLSYGNEASKAVQFFDIPLVMSSQEYNSMVLEAIEFFEENELELKKVEFIEENKLSAEDVFTLEYKPIPQEKYKAREKQNKLKAKIRAYERQGDLFCFLDVYDILVTLSDKNTFRLTYNCSKKVNFNKKITK